MKLAKNTSIRFTALLFSFCCLNSLPFGSARAAQPAVTAVAQAVSGPTLHLKYAPGQSSGDPLADFMYFVPLISPEPVSVAASPANNQRARVLSSSRHFTEKSFTVSCEFAFEGSGYQRHVFDHSQALSRNERKLKAGEALEQQLASINVEGPGAGILEVEGIVENGAPRVMEVRMRFNAHGHSSPVSIDLHDIRRVNGVCRFENEMVARVNTLTFKRKPGAPKMDISVASVKRKDSGNGFWANMVGGIKGTAANLLIKPVAVEPVGHQSMLDFGSALVAQAPQFTFPKAQRLIASAPSPGV